MTGTATPRGTGPWDPLRNRIFRALFIAQIASNVGTMMHNVGATWLMGDIDPSAGVVALVQTAIMLPVFLVGLPAGALADIVDRRRLLIVTQLSMMLTALALAVMTFADLVNEQTLLLLTFVLGLGSAFNMPAWQAIQPGLTLPDPNDYGGSANWVWNEGIPEDIPVFEGRRVVLLGPRSYPRSWRAQRTFNLLPAELAIERRLTAAEARDWLQRMLAAKETT